MDTIHMKSDPQVIQRFHRTLVEEIHRDASHQVERPFTVAEIYQSLVPYRTHRDRIGVEMNGDYEDALLRLLAGEGGFLVLGSDSARERIRKELTGSNPNTGLYREFAAVEVRLNPEKLPPDMDRSGFSPAGTARDAGGAESDPEPDLPGIGSPASGPSPSAPPKTAGAGSGAGERALPDPCPECERPLPARQNLRFCPHCGANPHQVECSACGEELEREWSYCIACGTPSES